MPFYVILIFYRVGRVCAGISIIFPYVSTDIRVRVPVVRVVEREPEPGGTEHRASRQRTTVFILFPVLE